MKVLLLAPSKSIHTHKWALFYQEQGIDVKVVTFKDHYSPENAKEVETIVLPKWLPGKLSYISTVSTLKKVLSSFQPDILHSHYVSSYGFVGAIAGYHPFYVSVWGRDIYQFPKQNTLNRKIVEYTLKKADVICSTSHVMAQETKKYTNKAVEVTPFGVDITKFKPLPKAEEKREVTIGTVKALSDKYGIADLIKAFAKIRNDYPNTNLLIVGDGPQRKEYELLAEQLGVRDVTTFTGRVPNTDVPKYINKMDIFAVPSTEDSESFGVAAVEAMACGVPVVVSNVGGLPEVVKDGITGLVVPKESPEKLAEAFETLLRDPSLRSKMGEKGILHVKEHYNWIENASRMLHLYKQTLNEV
ncbi:glycosyltransferase [Parageobacillus sp. G301]|jgi:L-malate glycosyltransferase|uniref:glycosyltransferase n=1 Tax=Parageobacillus sp. G301 TaxID=2998290 RepID=UPI002497DD7D|nr:glycosyltransferase [Parageobacillus sp. G301]GLH64253.1 capsular polysaccharide biosynthesis protein [Parageobacillus sp. G301]